MRRLTCLLLILSLLCAAALAELDLPHDTPGQAALAEYIRRVNEDLVSVGNAPVNSAFMVTGGMAILGVTEADNAEIPERVEMTFQLYADSINTLQLRVSDPDLFGVLAAACLHAASAEGGSMRDVLGVTQLYVDRVKKSPGNSFDDGVIWPNGASPRAYYAYYPNQYHDGTSWLQLTLIFPLYGHEGGLSATPTPSAGKTSEDEYEGIDVKDNYMHFEVFTTATPEPDSPAGESDSGL